MVGREIDYKKQCFRRDYVVTKTQKQKRKTKI